MEKLLTGIGALALIVGVTIFTALVKLWAILKLWAWFLAPLGLEPIPAVNLYGILLMISIIKGLSPTSTADKKTEEELSSIEKFVKVVTSLLSYIGTVLLLVLIGYIVKRIFL